MAERFVRSACETPLLIGFFGAVFWGGVNKNYSPFSCHSILSILVCHLCCGQHMLSVWFWRTPLLYRFWKDHFFGIDNKKLSNTWNLASHQRRWILPHGRGGRGFSNSLFVICEYISYIFLYIIYYFAAIGFKKVLPPLPEMKPCVSHYHQIHRISWQYRSSLSTGLAGASKSAKVKSLYI